VKYRRAIIVVVFVVVAVSVQTTLFARLRPFEAAPALGVLVVIALSRHLSPEMALFTGFLTGLFQDLLADSVLGLWALTLSVTAFVTVRIRDRLTEDVTLVGPAVFALSLGALALFAVLSTIFGQKTLADAGLVRKMLLPSAYNLVLGILVLPIASRLLESQRRRVGGWHL
jgi:rod shape-determining protein MreD